MYTKIKYDKKRIKLLIMATLMGLVLLLSSWLLIHFEFPIQTCRRLEK